MYWDGRIVQGALEEIIARVLTWRNDWLRFVSVRAHIDPEPTSDLSKIESRSFEIAQKSFQGPWGDFGRAGEPWGHCRQAGILRT